MTAGGLLFLAGVVLLIGTHQSLSVFQGNVYDVYSDAPGGGLIASCVSFDQYLALGSEPQYAQYGLAAEGDSKCGPLIAVTETVVSSTTFTNGGGVACPPQGASPGSVFVCGGMTVTVTSTSSSAQTAYCGNVAYNPAVQTCETATSSSVTLTTSTLTLTNGGTTSTAVVTSASTKSSSLGLSQSQEAGIGLVVVSLPVIASARKRRSG